MLDILFSNPLVFVLLILALIISITVHEFAHAYAAFKLGDPTAKSLGRLTINPVSHVDPLGLLFLVLAGFGWGRPVPFDPFYLKNPKRDAAIISFAGPLSNFILATIFSTIFFMLPQIVGFSIVRALIYYIVLYNVILGVFNLIPVAPLDGFKIVYGLLPMRWAVSWQQMEPYGVLLLLLLIFTDSTSKIISPFVAITTNILGLK